MGRLDPGTEFPDVEDVPAGTVALAGLFPAERIEGEAVRARSGLDIVVLVRAVDREGLVLHKDLGVHPFGAVGHGNVPWEVGWRGTASATVDQAG